jgi:hypothetical protein
VVSAQADLPKPIVELKVTLGHGHDIETLINGVPLNAGLIVLSVANIM